jgi:hypothetical protein
MLMISGCALALALTAPVGASPAAATSAAMTPAPTCKQADANKDGEVSRDEAAAAKILHDAGFDNADQDRDGRLSKVEYNTAIKAPKQQGG